MKLSDFNYTLPQELIAQKPMRPRDYSRLLVVEKNKEAFQDLHFYNISRFLKKGDVLVVNDSKVIPARLNGVKETGGKVEVLLMRRLSPSSWQGLLKNFKEAEIGKTISIGESGLIITPEKIINENIWQLSFNKKGAQLAKLISQYGSTPIPPYIQTPSTLENYQTIYATHEGSVAAPTAGFHFSNRILKHLQKKGVRICKVTLHVGPGTFLPIRVQKVTDHVMHPEFALLDKKTATILNTAKKEGRRVIAVGTTSVRVLESFCDAKGVLAAGKKDVNLFIYPGYTFKMVDCLITNFHLPESTLLLLVCAFSEWKEKGGSKKILSAYREAVKRKYRFYSFGDSMLIM